MFFNHEGNSQFCSSLILFISSIFLSPLYGVRGIPSPSQLDPKLCQNSFILYQFCYHKFRRLLTFDTKISTMYFTWERKIFIPSVVRDIQLKALSEFLYSPGCQYSQTSPKWNEMLILDNWLLNTDLERNIAHILPETIM